MEKKMENEMETLGLFKEVYRDILGYYPNNGESNGKEHGKRDGNWDYRGY